MNAANYIVELAELVAKQLSQTQHRLVLAESCTAGLVAATLAGVPGISASFCGSAVTYRDATKSQWLSIDADFISQRRAVSADVTREMSKQVLLQTHEATLAAAVTGHLGPGVEPGVDGIAYVCVAARVGDHLAVASQQQHRLRNTNRIDRQREATGFVLSALRDWLSGDAERGDAE